MIYLVTERSKLWKGKNSYKSNECFTENIRCLLRPVSYRGNKLTFNENESHFTLDWWNTILYAAHNQAVEFNSAIYHRGK